MCVRGGREKEDRGQCWPRFHPRIRLINFIQPLAVIVNSILTQRYFLVMEESKTRRRNANLDELPLRKRNVFDFGYTIRHENEIFCLKKTFWTIIEVSEKFASCK